MVNPEGEIYVGQTSDLEKRLRQHNDPNYKPTMHTKRRAGPWKLVYYETLETRAEAMRREKQLKSGKGREWIKTVVLKRKEEIG